MEWPTVCGQQISKFTHPTAFREDQNHHCGVPPHMAIIAVHHGLETAPLCEDTVMEEFEEFDEDGLVDSDDDDNSWKVRRAALKVS